MNETPFWVPVVVSIGLTAIVGAFLLPIVEAAYRLENWLVTWPLPKLERAERRDGFEEQLAAFLGRERQLGYRPVDSGLHLLCRMLSTLVANVGEGSGALARKAALSLVSVALRKRFVTRCPSATIAVVRLWIRLDGTAATSRQAALPLLAIFVILLALDYAINSAPQLGLTASDAAHFTESASVVKTTVVH